ncbi:MAG: hypothetical protein ACRD68_08125, partial [Pyrinomonadaceae bacterium]
AWAVEWALAGSDSYKGIGIQLDDTLGVAWGAGTYGVAVYRIGKGKLDGFWTSVDEKGALGTEDSVLEGTDDLNGVYKITRGTSATGGRRYSGTMTVKPRGEVYAVRWALARESFDGVGVRQGDVFVVGWGGDGGGGSGVAAYRVKERGTLEGRWATPAGTRLGSESLVMTAPNQ